jgi:cytochrome c oxidase assembly protein Cox11
MRKSDKRRVSPALAISIVALVLAAGGTSYANAPVAFVAKALGLNGTQKKQVKAIADKRA